MPPALSGARFSPFRSALYVVTLIVATIVGAVLALLCGPFTRTGDPVLWLARRWARVLLWAAGVKVIVKMECQLDPHRPYVFAANHLSSVDIFALFVALPMNIRFVAKKQLGQIPLFGWAMAAGRFIFIDRKNPIAARRSIDRAAARIRDGSSVAIFPEGTRSRDGLLGPFKKGGFHLAHQAGVPVVPVAIQGAGEVMPPGSVLVRPGRVTIIVGEPVETKDLKDLAARNALVDRVRSEIERKSGQKSRPPSPEPGRAA
jgi:1-acyl-sn-glycerol-3-phosphate acyltransferase